MEEGRAEVDEQEHGADDDEGEESVGGANEDVLSAIKFQVAAIGKELMCAICRDTFNDPFSLPCNHAFCHDCIKEGLKLRNACPLCQVPAFPRSLQKNNCLGNLATAYETLQQLLSRAAASSSSSSARSFQRYLSNTKKAKREKQREQGLNDDSALFPSSQDITEVNPHLVHEHEHALEVLQDVLTSDPDASDPTTSSSPFLFAIRSPTASSKRRPKRAPLKDVSNGNNSKRQRRCKREEEEAEREQDAEENEEEDEEKENESAKENTAKRYKRENMSNKNITRRSSTIACTAEEKEEEEEEEETEDEEQINQMTTRRRKGSHVDNEKLGRKALQPTNETHQPLLKDVMPQDEYPTAAVFASVTEPSASPKFVLLGTGLDKKKTAELRQVCNKLGGKMVNKFTKEVTHLVTADSSLTMRRTIKYFLSLLKGGVWIVNWDWIEYSSKQKKFLEESLFEIRGDTVATGAPSKARLNNSSCSSCSSSSSSSTSATNTRKKLFHGKTFFLAGKFDPPNPKKTELESIIEAGGGTVLSSLQKKQKTRKASNHTDKKRSSEKRKRKEEHEEEEGHETIYVLCDPTCSTEEVKKIERRCGRRPLSLLWLLDSLSHFRLLDASPYYRDTS
ncbi:E3 ubiquitin-protein ligase TRIM47 [Balamuthia mandrillaris]